MNDQDIRTAFERLDRDVRSAVRSAESLQRVSRRRRTRMMLVPAAAAAVVAVVVSSGALLLDDAEPEPVATTLPTATTPTPTPLPTVRGTAPALQPGDVLAAGPEGVAVVRGDEVVTLATGPARVAAGDRRGGLVYESAGDIWHLPAGATEPTLLVPGADLHDVAIVDGEPAVLFTEHLATADGDGVAAAVSYLGLDSRTRVAVLATDGYEGSITRVSYAGGIFAISHSAEGIDWFEFVDAAGDPVDVANPRPFEADSQEDLATGQGVLNPDGDRLVFIQGDEQAPEGTSGFDVVVWNLVVGAEALRWPLAIQGADGAPLPSFQFVRIDSDGQVLLVGAVDADRNPLQPLRFDLAGPPDATLVAAAGAPSIVGAGVPVEQPVAPEAAVIPAEGFGRGLLVATGEAVRWLPDPSDPRSEGRAHLVWEYRGEDLMLGADRRAFEDGSGGAVFGGGGAPVRWLPPGATAAAAVELVPGGGDFPFTLHGVAPVDGTTVAYGTRFDGERIRLLTVALASGATAEVAALDLPGGWVSNVSFDGERFWVAGYERPGADYCTRTFTVGTDGGIADAPGVPATCSATTLSEQARVSPDGSLVAYIESGYAGTEPELGDILRTGSIDLVVARTSDGSEVARIPAGTDTQDIVLVHDFDGERIVLSRQAPEPALSQQVMFVLDLGCAGCAGRVDTVAAGAGLTGPAAPVTEVVELPPLPGCSTDGLFVPTGEQAGLPAEVAAVRAAILAAAAACDFTALDELALAGDFSHNFDAGSPGMFLRAEQAGAGEVRLIAQVLGLPFGAVEAGDETIYVWPRVATYETWDQVRIDEQNELAAVYDFPIQRQFGELGGYYGLRVGITTGGDWVFVASGD